MTRQATVVFDVSGHGLGHLSQIAPVAQALMALFPGVCLVVRTAHPNHIVRDFMGFSVELDRLGDTERQLCLGAGGG
jgi:hypothetical protein